MAPETVEKVINSVWLKAGFAGIAILVSIGWAWTERQDCQAARAEMVTVQKQHKEDMRDEAKAARALVREVSNLVKETNGTLTEIKVYLRESRRYERPHDQN